MLSAARVHGSDAVTIGCDYHPGFQQIAFVDADTGVCGKLSAVDELE
jgi:hypothetical protein